MIASCGRWGLFKPAFTYLPCILSAVLWVVKLLLALWCNKRLTPVTPLWLKRRQYQLLLGWESKHSCIAASTAARSDINGRNNLKYSHRIPLGAQKFLEVRGSLYHPSCSGSTRVLSAWYFWGRHVDKRTLCDATKSFIHLRRAIDETGCLLVCTTAVKQRGDVFST